MKLPNPFRKLLSLQKLQLEATDLLRNDVVNTIRHENRLLLTLIRFSSLPDKTLRFFYRGCEIAFYIPDADTDLIQRDILMYKTFFDEPALRSLANRVDLRGKHVLDAGANIGNHTIFFTKICGAASVLSFEPNPAAFAILQRNIELNGLGGGVRATPKGLSDNDSPIYIRHEDPSNVGGTSFGQAGSGASFACTLIDELHLDKLDFLKIDVEGMPDRVLKGALQTIAHFKPAVYIELFPHEKDVPVTILRDIGYSAPKEISEHNYLFVARP